MAYRSMQDVEDAIFQVLGDYANQFDITAIAHDATEWADGALILTEDDDLFWAIVETHEVR